MRVNNEIRAFSVRVIGKNGEQLGVLSLKDALRVAEESSLDLVEVASQAKPPVCRVMDYGKFRYEQTKREKKSKKDSHQIKVKEIKFKPNVGIHDLNIKLRRAKEFIAKGDKVKFTCVFRGREVIHKHLGENLMQKIMEEFADIATIESPLKSFGRFLIIIFAPKGKKK